MAFGVKKTPKDIKKRSKRAL